MSGETTYHASGREAVMVDRSPTPHHQQAHIDQKMTFVAKHPEYGYGCASNYDANPDSRSQLRQIVSSAVLAPEKGHGKPSPGGLQKRLVDCIRERDFPHLLQEQQPRHGSGGLVYLDHAGATLYGASQLRNATESLLRTVHGNPHSQGPVSSVTAGAVDAMRLAVLQHFSANPREWKVVFTSGATASLKLVGEQFPWSPEGVFVHARDSHNSVLGVREYARAAGADVRCVDLNDFETDSSRSPSYLLGKVVEPTVNVGGCTCSDADVSGSSATCRGGYRGDTRQKEERDQPRSNVASRTMEEERSYCSHGGDEQKNDRYGCWEVAGSGVRQRTVGTTDNEDRERGLNAVRGIDDNHAATCAVYDDGIQSNRTSSRRSHGHDDGEGVVDCLFAFPAECNATGARSHLSIAGLVKRCGDHHPSICNFFHSCSRSASNSTAAAPEAVAAAEACPFGAASKGNACAGGRRRCGSRRKRRWWVLLDAAKFVGTAPLDLSNVEADFVALSFYKMFGYPTGLGALLVRDHAAAVLRKRFFGGGAVVAALAGSPFQRYRSEPERRLSDGTENFLAVLSLKAGFETLKSIGGMEAIAAHTFALARDLHAQLTALRHGNNDPVLRFFGRWDCSGAGSASTRVRMDSDTSEGSRARQLDSCSVATSVQNSENDPHFCNTPNGNGIPEGKGVVDRGRSGNTAAANGKGDWRAEGAQQCDGVSEAGGRNGDLRNRQGPVLAMVFLRPGGAAVGHAEVDKLAGLEGIQLRTGCFCNPGACQAALGLSDRDVVENLEKGHVCWDEHDLINDRPTGLVRVSLGWMSTWEDTAAFVGFVRKHFVIRTPLQTRPDHLFEQSDGADKRKHSNTTAPKGADGAAASKKAVANRYTHTEARTSHRRHLLEAIYVYPIKSCAPQRVGALPSLRHRSHQSPSSCLAPSDVAVEEATVTVNTSSEDAHRDSLGKGRWPVGPTGLAFDREWAVVDHLHRALRLKQAPKMCKIRPFVDFHSGTLTVSAPGMPDLVLPLEWGMAGKGGNGDGTDGAVVSSWKPPTPAKSRGQPKRATSTWSVNNSAAAAAANNDDDDNDSKNDNDKIVGESQVNISKSSWVSQLLSPSCDAFVSQNRGSGSGSGGEGAGHIAVVRVCGNRRTGLSCATSASAWFTRFLGMPCSLVRAAAVTFATDNSSSGRNPNAFAAGRGPARGILIAPETTAAAAAEAATAEHEEGKAAAGRAFANEAPYLLVSQASVAKVNKVIRESCGLVEAASGAGATAAAVDTAAAAAAVADGMSEEQGSLARAHEEDIEDGEGDIFGGADNCVAHVTAAHFRPNFVVGGLWAHEEDEWKYVKIGNALRFRVTGPCSRCSMINIDPNTGDTSGVALRVLAGYRRRRSNILFGQFLTLEKQHTQQPSMMTPTRAAAPNDLQDRCNAGDAEEGEANRGLWREDSLRVGAGDEWQCWVCEGMVVSGVADPSAPC